MSRRPDPTLFAALGDATRLALVDRLLPVPWLSTTQLARGTNLTRQAVRKHLDVLEGVGLVSQQKVGRERRWSVDPQPLQQIRDWTDRTRAIWEARFDRLDQLLEQTGEPDAR